MEDSGVVYTFIFILIVHRMFLFKKYLSIYWLEIFYLILFIL